MQLESTTVILFALLFVAVGLLHFKLRPDPAAFHVNTWSASRFAVFASLLGLFGAGELVTFTELWYLFGWTIMFFFVGVALAFLFLSTYSDRARSTISDGDPAQADYLITDLISRDFGRPTAIVTALISYAGLGSLYLIQVVVGAELLASVSDLSYASCVLTISLVCGAYISLGGLQGILATDKLQVFTMLIGLGALLFLIEPGAVVSSTPSSTGAEAFARLSEFDFWLAITLLVGGFSAICGGADVWQRLLCADSDRSARVVFLSSFAGWIVLGVLMAALGSSALRALPPELIGNTTPFIALVQGSAGSTLGVVMSVSLVCALFSTADTEAFVISTVISREFSRPGPAINPQITRLLCLVTTALGLFLALALKDRIAYLYTVLFTLLMVSAPIGAAVLLRRGSVRWTFVGSMVGVTIFSGLLFADYANGSVVLQGPWALLVALPTTLTTLLPSRVSTVAKPTAV